VADPDPLRARWARWRAEQVARLAARMEPRDRVEANRLWQRVLCLDPGDATALQGVERTRPRVVLPAAEPPPAAPLAPRPRSTAAAAPRTERAGPGAELGRAEEMIRDARFDDALAELDRLRPRVARAERPAESARLEVLAATAQVAFGDEAAARASLARALRADPSLALDARSTPPKLLRVFEAARSASAPSYTPATSDLRPAEAP
jgi:hypothetical protein